MPVYVRSSKLIKSLYRELKLFYSKIYFAGLEFFLKGPSSQGTQGFLHCSFKSGAFHVWKGISQNIFLPVAFFLVLTSRTSLGLNDFQIVHIHKK